MTKKDLNIITSVTRLPKLTKAKSPRFYKELRARGYTAPPLPTFLSYSFPLFILIN